MKQQPELSPGARRVMLHAKNVARDYKHDFITTEHILLGILESSRPVKGVSVMRNLEVDTEDFKSFVISNLQKYKGDRKPKLQDIEPSSRVLNMLSYASSIAKEMGTDLVQIDHILLSILVSDAGSGNNLFRLKNLDVNFLYEAIYVEVLPNKRAKSKKKQPAVDETDGIGAEPYGSKADDSLEKYATNLTAQAATGEIDPVIGREFETQNMIQILCRRTKNNPVLIGEPGVGKTAVVELLAQKIVSRDVPRLLRDKHIYTLDLARLVAGTIYRGQFEERLKEVIASVQSRDDIILFIDELHMLVGAGSGTGSMDASNILKPALARGKLSCIGATTLQEYKEFIEDDGALERRFQTVLVDEPTFEDTIHILKGVKDKYEQFHRVRYNAGVISEIVYLCDRYITDKNFPDKAIDVLDEIGSRANVDRYTPNADIDVLRDELLATTRRKERATEIQDFDIALGHRETEYSIMEQLGELLLEREKQESNNTAHIRITKGHIKSLISDKTGVPVSALNTDEATKMSQLEGKINKQVIGQTDGVKKICNAIKRNRAGVSDPNKPICSLLFLGPTGVGKTFLAKTLGDEMFDSTCFKQYDMSEFSEKHSTSKLIGSPPGYVGYGEGGSLTEFIRHTPYSVILLDEVEKAHPEVLQLFLQVLEYGCLTDSEGIEVNFKNTIIVMTSNIGAHKFEKQSSVGFAGTGSVDESVIEELKKMYAPEFVNRFDELVVFNKLCNKDLLKISNRLMSGVKRTVKSNSKKIINYTSDVCDMIVERCEDVTQYGARPMKRTITELVETPLADYMISNLSAKKITLSVEDDKIKFDS